MSSTTRLPADVVATRRTPTFTETSVPVGLLKDHSTKPGVWGQLTVERGSLLYCVTEAGSESETEVTPASSATIEPTVVHCVRVTGPVAFYVQFYERNL